MKSKDNNKFYCSNNNKKCSNKKYYYNSSNNNSNNISNNKSKSKINLKDAAVVEIPLLIPITDNKNTHLIQKQIYQVDKILKTEQQETKVIIVLPHTLKNTSKKNNRK